MAATERVIETAQEEVITFDGLRVERSEDGFTFETPDIQRTGLSEAELREVAGGDPYVRDWHFWEQIVGGHGTPRRHFLRWLEDAEDTEAGQRHDELTSGIARNWGELRIEVGLAGKDGHRVYELRHEDDRTDSLSDLEVYDDPLPARDIVKQDDSGRYRPLSTAPTLPHGFAFVGLDSREVVQAVDFVYPATVANWHREQVGELDITHYRETAERQTGIYDMIKSLPAERVGNLAEACCVDSQCLKRREWDESESHPLDVPRGDGKFPCREPCSLVVAAARQFTILEGETPREYTFELTPSEKNQLEDLITAVAEDRRDEIREADVGDGANRYRARYLRAKRMRDGDLCGVPTTGSDQD